MAATPRLGLRFPALDGSDAPDVPLWMNRLAVDVEAALQTGNAAQLPAAGKAGRRFYVTDRHMDMVDTGAEWAPTSAEVKLASWFVETPEPITFTVPPGFRALRVRGHVGSTRNVIGDGFCGLSFIPNGVQPNVRWLANLVRAPAGSAPTQSLSGGGPSPNRVLAAQVRGNGDTTGWMDLLIDLSHVNYSGSGNLSVTYHGSSHYVDTWPDFTACTAEIHGGIDVDGLISSLTFTDDTGADLAYGTDLTLYGVL